MPGVASMISDSVPANFAEWRWNALSRVMKEIAPILATLKDRFPFHIYRQSKDPQKVGTTGITDIQ